MLQLQLAYSKWNCLDIGNACASASVKQKEHGQEMWDPRIAKCKAGFTT
jgi:hypothetical protein